MGLGLFAKQRLKLVITDTNIEFAALLDYLSTGQRKAEITGQLAGLLEAISESGTSNRNVHVIGYSFGSIIAIDAIFPTSKPTKKLLPVLQQPALMFVACR